MALLSDLVDDVLEHVPRCSVPLAESAIADTAIDFLKRAKLHSVDHAAISLVAGTAAYALTNPDDYQILHVKSATIDGKPIIQTSEEQLDLEWQELSKGFSWRYQYSEYSSGIPVDDWRLAESELPGLFYQLTPNEVILVGKPTVAITNALVVKVVVFPVRGVTEIPDWIFNTHHQALADGAIGRLKAMPEKPFSDRGGAQRWIDGYEDAVNLAERTGLRGHQRNDKQQLRTRVW